MKNTRVMQKRVGKIGCAVQFARLYIMGDQLSRVIIWNMAVRASPILSNPFIP